MHSYRFSAFGVERNPDANNTNPFRFAGELWDWALGEYYLRARTYSPRLGRFSQPDPHWTTANMIFGDSPTMRNDRYMPSVHAIMQSSNLFLFTMHNPVFWSDPSGLAATATGGTLGYWAWKAWKAWQASRAAVATVAYYAVPLVAGGILLHELHSQTDIARLGSYAVRQNIGTIAGGFGNLQCVAAADAMQAHLTKHGRRGEVLVLHFHDTRNGLVASTAYMDGRVAISETAMHMGVKYNNLVHCTVHPQGIIESAWIKSFITAGGGSPTVVRIPF